MKHCPYCGNTHIKVLWSETVETKINTKKAIGSVLWLGLKYIGIPTVGGPDNPLEEKRTPVKVGDLCMNCGMEIEKCDKEKKADGKDYYQSPIYQRLEREFKKIYGKVEIYPAKLLCEIDHPDNILAKVKVIYGRGMNIPGKRNELLFMDLVNGLEQLGFVD